MARVSAKENVNRHADGVLRLDFGFCPEEQWLDNSGIEKSLEMDRADLRIDVAKDVLCLQLRKIVCQRIEDALGSALIKQAAQSSIGAALRDAGAGDRDRGARRKDAQIRLAELAQDRHDVGIGRVQKSESLVTLLRHGPGHGGPKEFFLRREVTVKRCFRATRSLGDHRHARPLITDPGENFRRCLDDRVATLVRPYTHSCYSFFLYRSVQLSLDALQHDKYNCTVQFRYTGEARCARYWEKLAR